MYYVLLNPKSSTYKKQSKKVAKLLKKKDIPFKEVNVLLFEKNSKRILKRLKEEDVLVIVGGDGTLNNLGNKIKHADIKQKIMYYPGGNGNDFSRDFKEKIIDITDIIKKLPEFTVNDNETIRYFFNGVGIGIEGEVCELVNNGPKSKIAYFKTAYKTIVGYERYDIHVLVDGKEYDFNNCKIASIMFGRYQGGGMKFAPNAKRDSLCHLVVASNINTFRLLLLFPTIFSGLHRKLKCVNIIEGKDFTITSSRNNHHIQYDGEVLPNIYKIHVVNKN